MQNTLKFTALLAVLLLLAAALMSVVLGLLGMGDVGSADAAPTPTAQVVTDPNAATPTPGTAVVVTPEGQVTPYLPTVTTYPAPPAQQHTITPTPKPTAKPTPTLAPTPTPTPKPTAQPTPTPVPAGISLGSGSFSSDTGVPINLAAVWSAETVDGSSAKIHVTANLRSYSLNAVASAQALIISVNGQSTALNVAALDISTGDEVTTELGKTTFTVSAPAGTTTIPVTVTWHFGGTYSGVDLTTITASGEITLTR